MSESVQQETSETMAPCWQCPNCGWIVSETAYLSILTDVTCPGCAEYFSHFHRRTVVSEIKPLRRKWVKADAC